MRLILAACIAAALTIAVRGDCDACIDGLCYNKNLIPGAKGHPSAIYRKTNTLYVIGERRNEITKCNLDTATCTKTVIRWDINTIAVDQTTGDIYGSVYPGFIDRSIYQLDFVNNARLSVIRNENSIWHLAFKNKLYFASLGRGIYTSDGTTSRIVPGTENYVMSYFFIDKNDNIYYRTFFDGIRFVKKSSNTTLGQPISWDNDYHVTVDKDGEAMLFNWFTNAVYRVTNGQQVEVGAVRLRNYYYDILLDRDNNIICTMNDERYHLKRESNSQCTTIKNDKGFVMITEKNASNTNANNKVQ